MNLLVLALEDGVAERVRDAVEARLAPPDRIHVVVPAKVSALDWLATADDAGLRDAEARVLELEWTLADDATVDGEAGDVDPLQAVEDALRRFAADEILVAGRMDADFAHALGGFGIPLTRIDSEAPRRSTVGAALHRVAGGHESATPFVLFLGVNAAFLVASVAVSLVVLALLWALGDL